MSMQGDMWKDNEREKENRSEKLVQVEQIKL